MCNNVLFGIKLVYLQKIQIWRKYSIAQKRVTDGILKIR